MKKAIRNWYLRWFKVIDEESVKELELIHLENLYGDSINHLNCRSLWKDKRGRIYRANFLKEDNE